ncbi:MAG: TIGR03619 family F420-dependent LLM class oxidoreductase [Pseudomonadota bacterium]
MKLGLFATFMSPLADRLMIRDFAQRCEAIGVESIWMGEHVVLFDETEHPYPGSAKGKLPVPDGGGLLDTVATFGYLAGLTETLRFGTGISLISQRNPLYTAKEFATLDWLTGGRIDFGVGVGWCKEEVLASGYSWEDRGARSNEFLQLLTSLWTEPTTTFNGDHFQVGACHMDPKPLQTPHVPIIVGGHSRAALQRAARYGNGWYGFQLDPAGAAPIIDTLRQMLADHGRKADEFEFVITPNHADAETVAAFAQLGVQRLVLHLGSQKPAAIDHRLDEIQTLIQAIS